MPLKFLKPANDKLKVRDPMSDSHLPAEGKDVEFTTYWRRRLNDGDVLVLKEADAAKVRNAIKAKAKAEAKAAAKEREDKAKAKLEANK